MSLAAQCDAMTEAIDSAIAANEQVMHPCACRTVTVDFGSSGCRTIPVKCPAHRASNPIATIPSRPSSAALWALLLPQVRAERSS